MSGDFMKRFFVSFAVIILIFALFIAAAYGVMRLVHRFDDILSSKNTAVNNSEDKKYVTVVLDAGHGGRDGGAVGVTGAIEKELNLDIAKRIEAKLSEMGVSVVMTRTEDVMLESDGAYSKKNGDLKARLEIAEAAENSIFVSIHMNKFHSPSVKGTMIYYSSNNSDSKPLAEAVMSAVKDKLQPENKKAVKDVGSALYILNRTTRPAILIECGFISNSYEESLLMNEDYRERYAKVIADAVFAYINN